MKNKQEIVSDPIIISLQQAIKEAMLQTSIKDEVNRFESSVSGGKMLRGRLVLELGASSGLSQETLSRLGAAIELLHAGSLLHDDIIDGGVERRNVSALWVSEGTKSAVIVGDLLLSISLSLISENGPERIVLLIRALREMCDAEAEQEFTSAGENNSWENCKRIARRKTGILFGLAAACAAGKDLKLAKALEVAGIDLGTAYQLADDLLDVCQEDSADGKSMGTDATTGKLTAATFANDEGVDALSEIECLLATAECKLEEWPKVQQSWRSYVENHFKPVTDRFIKLSQGDVV